MTIATDTPVLALPKTQPKYCLWEHLRCITPLEDYIFDAPCRVIGITWATPATLIDGWWYHIEFLTDYPQGCTKRGMLDLAHETELHR